MTRTKREQNILIKEYIRVERKEARMMTVKGKKEGLMDKIRKKVPKKAMQSLEKAFEKGFFFLFDQGSDLIGKIGNMEKAMKEAEVYRASLERMVHPDTLRALDRSAGSRISNTKRITVAEGAGLGVLGIGLPDIPVFLAMLLKTAYEIGASYGFDYREEDERPYTLALLKVAFSEGEEQKEYNRECDALGCLIDDDELLDTRIGEEDLKSVSQVLAADMLVGKFIQGQTFVGAVGGVLNYKLVDKVARIAKLKYKKRFLYKMIRGSTLPEWGEPRP